MSSMPDGKSSSGSSPWRTASRRSWTPRGCRSSRRCRNRLRTACGGSRTARSRSVRALLVPLLRGADRGPARDEARPGRGRRRRGARGDRDRRRGARLARGLDLASPRRPDDLAESVRARYPLATDEEVARIRGLVEDYCGSEIAQRLATLEGATVERSFAFEHDGVLLHGRLDVFHEADGARARRRLQDERPRGRITGRGRRARVRPPAPRVRARVPACGRNRSRGHVPVPRGPKRSSNTVLLGRRCPGPGGGALAGDRGDPVRRFADAERVRLRDLPRARPRLCRAAPTLPSFVSEARRRVGPEAERILPIIQRLAAEHPDATIALRFAPTSSSSSP